MTPAVDPYSWRDVSDFSFYGPWGAQNPSGDLIVETRRWRERLFEQRAPARWTNPIVNRIVNQFPGGMFGGMGGGGQLALNQLLVVMDGIDSPPFMRRVLTNRINTLLDASYIVPRRLGKVSLRIPRARPARRADLLHRRNERAAGAARPGADAPGPHGTPRLVPHTDEGRPEGRLRSLPRQGGSRHGARCREAPRRDRADHERLLARDDRPGLLDGADERPARGQGLLRLGAPRAGDDDARIGHRGQRLLPRPRAAFGRHSRSGPRRHRARLPSRPRVEPALDAHAGRLRSAITRPSSARSGSAAGSTRRWEP